MLTSMAVLDKAPYSRPAFTEVNTTMTEEHRLLHPHCFVASVWFSYAATGYATQSRYCCQGNSLMIQFLSGLIYQYSNTRD
jgi:hypothetical protein